MVLSPEKEMLTSNRTLMNSTEEVTFELGWRKGRISPDRNGDGRAFVYAAASV